MDSGHNIWYHCLSYHCSNYIEDKQNPRDVIFEIYRMNMGYPVIPSDNLVPENLIRFGVASGVESFSFYFPTSFKSQDVWQYTYNPRENGLIGRGSSEKSVLYRLSPYGFLDYKEITLPHPYPDGYSQRERYSFELNEQGQTVLILTAEYRNPVKNRKISQGDHIGTFVLKKKFDTEWAAFDKEAEVNFNLYNLNGELKGGVRSMPKLILDKKRFSIQDVLELNDQDDEIFNSIIIPLKYQDETVGYISASISKNVTFKKIQQTVILFTLAGFIILLLIPPFTTFIAGTFTSQITHLTEVAQIIADGNLEKKINIEGRDEIGRLAKSFDQMRKAIIDKIRHLKQMDQLKDEFPAKTSHELHTPLHGMIGNLAIDDDPTNLRVITNYLTSAHFSVICHSSGHSALEWIQNNEKPDLILLDIMMPGMNGFEVCKILRHQFTIGDLPIIFLTASHRKNDLEVGFALGANDYLTKPFEKSELLLRIQAHLQILTARKHMVWLREYANHIATFKSHSEMFKFVEKKIKESQIANVVFLIKNEPITTKKTGPFSWFRKRPPEELLIKYKDQMLNNVLIINSIEKSNPFYQLYYDGNEHDLPGGHLAYLYLDAEYMIFLHRFASNQPFSELDREFMLNLIDQSHQIESNLHTMLSDKLIEALHIIQLSLSRIIHISADYPYVNVFFEDQDQPEVVEISLSSLHLYFGKSPLIKVHKSHLINQNKIITAQKKLQKNKHYKYEVSLGSIRKPKIIPIGPSYVSQLIQSYPQYFDKLSSKK